ncbi:MAG TPA: glycoside hydrolase family 97 N-terminal domain-containing protein [Tichowtungia sp.]|nr:glycoside hydrolase family 97 N-terminal domain-containing protein [Tichowtungia sp.]
MVIISYNGRPVIAESRLGLELSEGPALNGAFEIQSVEISRHDSTWTPVCGERSAIRVCRRSPGGHSR